MRYILVVQLLFVIVLFSCLALPVCLIRMTVPHQRTILLMRNQISLLPAMNRHLPLDPTSKRRAILRISLPKYPAIMILLLVTKEKRNFALHSTKRPRSKLATMNNRRLKNNAVAMKKKMQKQAVKGQLKISVTSAMTVTYSTSQLILSSVGTLNKTKIFLASVPLHHFSGQILYCLQIRVMRSMSLTGVMFKAV